MIILQEIAERTSASFESDLRSAYLRFATEQTEESAWDAVRKLHSMLKFAAQEAIDAFRSHERKRRVFVRDARSMSEEAIQAAIDTINETHDITEIVSMGSGKVAIIAIEHAPEVK